MARQIAMNAPNQNSNTTWNNVVNWMKIGFIKVKWNKQANARANNSKEKRISCFLPKCTLDFFSTFITTQTYANNWLMYSIWLPACLPQSDSFNQLNRKPKQKLPLYDLTSTRTITYCGSEREKHLYSTDTFREGGRVRVCMCVQCVLCTNKYFSLSEWKRDHKQRDFYHHHQQLHHHTIKTIYVVALTERESERGARVRCVTYQFFIDFFFVIFIRFSTSARF